MAVLTFGTRAGLYGELEWTGPTTGLSADITQGRLRIQLAGDPVWGGDAGALEWTWIELLEFMTNAWPYLLVEQSYPSPLNPAMGSALEDELRRAIADDLADEAALRSAVLEFLETHDLARALQGIIVEPLRLLRRGALMEVSTRARTSWLVRDDVLTVLTDLGDAIAHRMDGCDDERARSARDAWQTRADGMTTDLVVEIGSGLPPPLAAVVRHAVSREPAAANDYDNEILAAARMSGRFLEERVLRDLLDRVSSLGARRCPRLDELSRRALHEVPEARRDYEQGYALAVWARRTILGDRASGLVDVEGILRDLHVDLIDIDLDAPTIDAVAVFGPHHGPAILLNKSGQHAQGNHGRRATLAHELCHLLRDRAGALPFAEALSEDAPLVPERRARAFAAEFLLTQADAVRASEEIAPTTRMEWEQLVERLSRDYGTSQAIVAWQLKNGHRRLEHGLPLNVEGWLTSLANRSPPMRSS
jgi:hypothetical protein